MLKEVSVDQAGNDAQNVGILLFDGVQVTDFTGPYDVFVLARPAGTPNPIEAPPLVGLTVYALAL